MELTVDRDAFAKGLGWIQSVVEKRSTMPILSNVLLRGSGNELKIIATDLEVGIEGIIPAEIKGEGGVTLNARKMYDIIKEMPPGSIYLSVEDNFRTEIKGEKGVFHLMGTNESEYPPLPEYSKDSFLEIPAETFKEMIEKTIFAASTEETRYNLGGIYCQITEEKDKIRMVATDGHRLCMITRNVENADKMNLDKGLIIPRKGFNELRRLLSESVEKTSLSVISNNVIFNVENVTIIMRIMEGEYPDYTRVIPTDNDQIVEVNREQIIESLRRVSVISEEKTRGIKLTFEKGKIIIESQNPELGDAKEEIEVNSKVEGIDIGFNAKYLLEAFAALKGEKVKIKLKDSLSSGLLESDEDEGYLCVIMPMRL